MAVGEVEQEVMFCLGCGVTWRKAWGDRPGVQRAGEQAKKQRHTFNDPFFLSAWPAAACWWRQGCDVVCIKDCPLRPSELITSMDWVEEGQGSDSLLLWI